MFEPHEVKKVETGLKHFHFGTSDTATEFNGQLDENGNQWNSFDDTCANQLHVSATEHTDTKMLHL